MSTLAAHSTTAGMSGYAQRLAAAVRPEFRVEVLVPAVGDPILGTEQLSIPVDRGVSGDLRFGVLIAV